MTVAPTESSPFESVPFGADPQFGANPTPGNLVTQRSAYLAQQYPNLHPDVNVTLAGSGSSQSDMNSMAGALSGAVNDAWQTFTSWTHDPVLEKTPSFGLAVSSYLHSTLGPMPIADSDLSDIQKRLQQQGYGQGLPVSGAWSPEWQNAYSTFSHDQYSGQLAGNRPGAVSAHHAAHSFLSMLTPTHLADAIIGQVKALPGQIRNAAADLLSSATTLVSLPVTEVQHPGVEGVRSALRTGAGVGAGFETALGHGEGAAQYYGERQKFSRMINDVGTYFMFVPYGKAIGSANDAVRAMVQQGVVKDLGKDAALRGPGVIAQTFGQPITHGVSQFLENFPVLSRTGPWIRQLADTDGFYYGMRSLLAQPYRIPVIQAAGKTAQAAIVPALYSRAVAAASSKAGDQSLENAVTAPTILDSVNDAMAARLTLPHTGGLLSLDLDTLGAGLHGPISAGRGVASTALEAHGKQVADGIDALMGRVGVDGQVERATGQSVPDLVKTFGSEARYRQWLWNKIRGYVADHYAVDSLNRQPARSTLDFAAQQEFKRDRLAEFYAQPEPVVQAAVKSALTDKHFVENAMHHEMTVSATDFNNHLAQQANQWLPAADATTQLLTNYRGWLHTPQTLAETQLNKALGGPAPTIPQGAIGLVRKTTKMSNEARQDLTNFISRYVDAGQDPLELDKSLQTPELVQSVAARRGVPLDQNGQPLGALVAAKVDPALTQSLHQDLDQYLATHFGQGPLELKRFNSLAQKIGYIDTHANNLVGPVFTAKNAPTEMQRLLATIDEQGYKLGFARDIGHEFDHPFEPLWGADGRISRLRSWAGHLGISTEPFSDREDATRTWDSVRLEAQKAVDKSKVHLPAYTTVDDALRVLTSKEFMPATQPLAAKALQAFSQGTFARRARIALNIDLKKNLTAAEATQVQAKAHELMQEQNTALGLRDLKRKDVVRALMDPTLNPSNSPWVKASRGEEGTTDLPWFDEKSANNFYDAILNGYANRPGYMMGWSKFEDTLRATPAKLGWLGHAVLPNVILDLPNNYVRLRNSLRFNYSPTFAWRRVTKTNLKMGEAGIPLTKRPYETLYRKGVLPQAEAYYRKLFPEQHDALASMSDADYYLRSQGVTAVYNPTHYETYVAWHLKQMGLSDGEVKDNLARIFNYGGPQGRSALERSLNVLWFPFSFEKTVIRNTAGYLLDHPMQTLMLHHGLQAYDKVNQHHAVTQWVDDHLPLLKEFNRMNAFAEGISPGEFGGINAPLLNLFLPQQHTFTNATGGQITNTIKQMVPLFSDLNRIVLGMGKTQKDGFGFFHGDLFDQMAVGRNTFLNGWAGAKQALGMGQRSRPYLPMETPQAQVKDAHRMFLTLSGSLSKVIAFNDSHRSGQVVWPDSYPPDVRGKPVDRTTLRDMVAYFYPAYDPLAAQTFAQAQSRKADQWISGLLAKNDPDAQDYAEWKTLADKVIRTLTDPNADPQQSANAAGAFRSFALSVSEHDPRFYHFYNQFYSWAFGPLERP